MDDPEIQETVESILGKGAKVVDCEKKSSIKEEEVLFINGMPVTLEGRDGLAIKQALITGQVPPCDLLNTLLIKTGILKAPVKLDTSLSVKSTTVTKEEVTVSRDGKVVDERSRETKEQNFYTSAITEVYEPIKIIPTAELLNGKYARTKYSDNNGYETGSEGKFESSSSASSCESDGPTYKPQTCLSKDSGHLSNSTSTNKADFTPSSADSLSSLDEPDFLSEQFRKCTFNGTNGFRKDFTSLPQTPQTKSFSTVYNGEAVQENATDTALQPDNALVYRDGNLLSGSLEALIQHMVPTDVYYPDRAYLFAFLLSSRLFIKPHDLLARVRSLCETQQGLGSANGGASHPGQARFAEHLVQLLAEWTETFPYDFRDERVMQHVRTITQQCCAINPSIRGNVSSLLHNLLQRLTALEQYEKTLDLSAQPQDENCTDISEVCPVPAVLAQQLTHVELERLSFIGPEEFVQAFAKENPHLETSFKDMKKTHNLEQYVQWFNRLSYFVATQVCKYQKKKQRVRVVEYWIETGRECFNIGNFNSLMAIIAGLNMSPISRLKKTWNKIHSGKFAILEHQMDPSSNFSSYRSTLKAAMWRSHGAKDQRQRIVIPFFSLLVKDLYFLNQGCSNKLPNGHINFEKFWQLAKQVTEFMAWKQVTCPFEKDPKVISVLQHGPILNENALALASFDCEPPENNQEKERCKTLKADSTAM
ncbi:ras-GEF domain-containing family member 1B isoform X4 [Tribolium castaneum]|uniref:Ras-GEF domain-containing family member 1B-like Protein n=1 Tax=Tribolium castaneum TaxID=7070 RepID=D6WGH0_TRICA|nr:PREDICTED: ras-GEF domain-containing family member 1B isoform X4 [Tribolium castaneum]EFA01326.1 Ras-GEF domain-containing family member 1B-like Protein [Tribolium castaneum]|eukprot:XP_008190870.1 PREDICTED: ras-GEF domain-containing family member 1B isoform X4 [Tribolium castaneum]